MPTTNWRVRRVETQAGPLQQRRRDLRHGRVGDIRWRDESQLTVRVATRYEDPWVAAFEWRLPNTSAFMFRRALSSNPAGNGMNQCSVCTDYDLYFRLLLAGATLKAAPNAMSLYRHWSVLRRFT